MPCLLLDQLCFGVQVYLGNWEVEVDCQLDAQAFRSVEQQKNGKAQLAG